MVHEHAGFGALRVARVAVFGLWLLLVGLTPVHTLPYLANALFAPPGILGLLPRGLWDRLLTVPGLTLLKGALILALLAVVTRRRPSRPLMLLTTCGLLLFDGTLKGFGGYVNHSEMGLLYSAMLLALAPTAAERGPVHRWGDQREGRAIDPGSVLRCGALLLATVYMFVGLERLVVGGADVFLGDALPTYMAIRSLEQVQYHGSLASTVVANAHLILLAKVGFFVATLAEVASPFAVFHRKVRAAWLAVILPFHVATLLTMNIFFWENMVLIVVFFTDLPTRIDGLVASRRGPRPPDDPGRARTVIEEAVGH
jgi:hypothetical protein